MYYLETHYLVDPLQLLADARLTLNEDDRTIKTPSRQVLKSKEPLEHSFPNTIHI